MSVAPLHHVSSCGFQLPSVGYERSAASTILATRRAAVSAL